MYTKNIFTITLILFLSTIYVFAENEKEGNYYGEHIISIYERALNSYKKANNNEGMTKCRDAIIKLKQRIGNV